MKRIAILGGSFDPIHEGHLGMAKLASEQLELDTIILLPAGNPYFKKGVTDYELRYEMCVLGAADTACAATLEISRLEADESRPTYTYMTLEALHEKDGDAQIYFLCGADVLESIHSWKEPGRILELASLAVFERDGCAKVRDSAERLKERFSQARCVFIGGEVPDISSTMVRERVQRGESIRGLVTPSVESFIFGHGLYRSAAEGT